MAQLVERGGRGWWAELAHWATCHAGFVFCSGLPAKAQCMREERSVWSRKAEEKKNSGPGIWAKVYLYPWHAVKEVAGNRGSIRTVQLWPVGRRFAAYSKLRGSSFSQGRHQIKSEAVCTSAFATLRGQCITAPGPTEPFLEGLSSHVTAVSQVAAALLYWPDLTFNLRWGFKIYHPTFPFSFLY